MPLGGTNGARFRRLDSGFDTDGVLGVRELRKMVRRIAVDACWPDIDTLVERSWRLFARTAGFDAWLIAWPAGGAIELHDHGGSSGAVVVVSGALVETRAERNKDGRLLLSCRTLVAGGLPASFTGEEIHDVCNAGSRPALSLHLYSPRLTEMTFYEAKDEELAASRTEWVEDGQPELPMLPDARLGQW